MALDQNEIVSKVETIIAEQLGISKDAVTPDASLESLGADSLDRVKIVMELEEAFCIEIKDKDVEQFSTVGEFINYVQNLVK
jgi:acyl carrier protein